MKHSNRLFILLALSGLFALLATNLLVTARTAKPPVTATQPPSKIAPWVMDNTSAGREAEFFVLLTEQADVSDTETLSGKPERTRYIHDRLRDTAQRSQAPLLDWLGARGIAYQSFFLVNAVLVKGPRELAETLAARPDVARIEGNPAIRQREPVALGADELRALTQRAAAPQAVETGITAIRAPEVWPQSRGAGIVIGVADSGVKWDHTALQTRYRGWNGSTVSHAFNWHDAIHTGSGGGCSNDSPFPCDDHDHGTHVTGTAIGEFQSDQIGVAPDAKFIACRCMSQLVGTASSYIECLQWFFAPDGNANQAPDIVLTGWTCPPSEGCATTTLSSAVAALQSTGIMVVASAGSHGPDCSSIFDPPAILPEAYTVGAVAVDPANLNNITLAAFSGRGPVTVDGSNRLKPEILAPGVFVRSAVRAGGYANFSGTSMSAAHVAGAVALLWSARPTLRHQITRTINVLNDAAVDMPSAECGTSATVPNNATGYGRLDIKRAVDLATAIIAPSSQTIASDGGTGSVTVTAGTGVGWAVFNNAAWVTITSGSSGTGNGAVNYSVTANTGTQPREATLVIAGHVFTVTQAATCPYTLNPSSRAVPVAGGSYTVSVTTNGGCAWTAQSSAAWLSITAGTGTGSGTMSYTVASNPGIARIATITVADQTHTVTQSGAPLVYYPLPAPVRLLETRAGLSGCTTPGAPINANGTLTLPARTTCAGIPAQAAVVTGNITVVPSGPGFLTLFPSDVAQPTVANSNYGQSEVVNNVYTVGLGNADGAFKIYASSTTHVIVDVTGYYAPLGGTGGLYFHQLPAPVRLLETRAGLTGCITPGTPLTGTGNQNADPNLDLLVQGRSPVAAPCNTIPAAAQVLAGNATSVLPSAGGYLTIYPSGGTRPTVASSNYAGSDVINGPFAVKLGTDGKFKVYTYATTHLVIDILGYYSAEATDVNGVGLLFNPLPSPVRLLETRAGLNGCTMTGAPIVGNLNAATHTQMAANFCTLPASAQAVVGNVSVVNTTGAGFLTLFPANLTTAPQVATSNYPTPATFGYNRHYIVGLNPADGKFKVLTQFTTDLILDASGYFAP